ncbi:hypothetical protein ACFVYE_42515 [Streptomyces sp. NPDC058239]|uniref:hypothetical protein n=2 Tax=unclassified Streptomyces TaxID=2593676 RepID=UPI0036E0ACDE
MQSDDKPINGQHNPNSPSFFNLIDQTPPPPVIDREDGPGTARNCSYSSSSWRWK